MKWTEHHWPGDQCSSGRAHFEVVAQESSAPLRQDIKAMVAVKSRWACELEYDRLTRLVCLDRVSNGPVPTDGAWLKRAVEPHPRPRLVWPQPIVARRETVKERSHLGRACVK